MDSRLYDAALIGNVTVLLALLQEDPFLLDIVRSVTGAEETPLHIAATFGHVDFAKELLNRKPELATVFNSRGQSPLHLASAKGHIEMVEVLLKADSSLCFVRDRDGRTLLHTAAMKGRIGVLDELIHTRPTATRMLTGRGETILHLCVKYNRFEALKLLVEVINDDEFVNFRDEDDNTVLHLSAALKQTQIVEYLLSNTRVELNALNANNYTAMDVLIQSSSEKEDIRELKEILQSAGAISSQQMSMPSDRIQVDNPTVQSSLLQSHKHKKHYNWINQKRDTIMVIAVLIATETFEAGLNPPGSVWQDSTNNVTVKPYLAGESVMAYLYPKYYIYFSVFNLIGFLASITIILLMISGLQIQRRLFMWILMVIMWIAVSSMVVTYGQAFYALASDDILHHLGWLTLPMSVFGFLGLVALIFTGHVFRYIRTLLKNLGIIEKKNGGKLGNENGEDLTLSIG